jgi:hypothetical protein
MAIINPFANDPDRGEAWELGYLAGFQDPDGGARFLPLAPELLDAYTQGLDAGREDRIQSPPAGDGTQWVPKTELAEKSSLGDLGEHILIEVIAEGLAHLFKQAAFGLIGVLITVLGIPGDTQLKPLDDDFSEPYTGPEDDTNVSFVAVCPRTDHPVMQVGTTADGYWTGSARTDFGDALGDMINHGHSEAGVARCSLTDGTCGLVWAAQ